MADPIPLRAAELEAFVRTAEPGWGGFTFLNGRSVSGVGFTSDSDFSERFVDSVVFERCTFEATPMFMTNLSNVRFISCEFVDCNFAKSELTLSVFESCQFRDSKFQRTMFSDCQFIDTAFVDCVFFAKSWFGGTATRTTFAGTGEQPRFVDDLISADVTWAIQPGLRPGTSDESSDAGGVAQLVSTLLLATVDDYDQTPISDDPVGTIFAAYRLYDRLGHPTEEVISALTPIQRLSLVTRFGQLCEHAINHKSAGYMSAAVMVYEIGANDDDQRHNYIAMGMYMHTLHRLGELGIEAAEPFSSAARFEQDRQGFSASLKGAPVLLSNYGLKEVVEEGITEFVADASAWPDDR